MMLKSQHIPRNRIDPRIPFQRAVDQPGQLFEIARRQVFLNLADGLADDVVIIQHPFRGQCEGQVLVSCFAEKFVRFGQPG